MVTRWDILHGMASFMHASGTLTLAVGTFNSLDIPPVTMASGLYRDSILAELPDETAAWIIGDNVFTKDDRESTKTFNVFNWAHSPTAGGGAASCWTASPAANCNLTSVCVAVPAALSSCSYPAHPLLAPECWLLVGRADAPSLFPQRAAQPCPTCRLFYLAKRRKNCAKPKKDNKRMLAASTQSLQK